MRPPSSERHRGVPEPGRFSIAMQADKRHGELEQAKCFPQHLDQQIRTSTSSKEEVRQESRRAGCRSVPRSCAAAECIFGSGHRIVTSLKLSSRRRKAPIRWNPRSSCGRTTATTPEQYPARVRASSIASEQAAVTATRTRPLGFSPRGRMDLLRWSIPSRFTWHDDEWKGLRLEGQVLYELHLGTFTREGTWNAAAERLPRLPSWESRRSRSCLSPSSRADFGWGYDGVDLFRSVSPLWPAR